MWSSMVGATVLILIGFRFLIWSAQYFGIENRLRFRYAQFVLGNLVSQGIYYTVYNVLFLVMHDNTLQDSIVKQRDRLSSLRAALGVSALSSSSKFTAAL